jgi:predicted nucleic acid-binding protein
MVIVADTGALISLAVIDKLELLQSLYGEVYIPPEVWREIDDVIEVFNIPTIRSLKDHVRSLSGMNIFADSMDSGEAEAAALYQELNADYLVIDDQNARSKAEKHGIRCIGAIAVLVEGRNKNLTGPLHPLFATLIARKRYYKKSLLNGVLAQYEEAPLD